MEKGNLKPLEIFRNFFYQIMNGGVEQPLVVNGHYRTDVVDCLEDHGNDKNNVVNAVFEDIDWSDIDGELQDKLEQFVCAVCDLCSYCEEGEFSKPCNYCGGAGEVESESGDYDEDGDSWDNSYEPCPECNGEGCVAASIDECDLDDLEYSLPSKYRSIYQFLDNIGDDLNKVFKLQSYSPLGGYSNGMKIEESASKKTYTVSEIYDMDDEDLLTAIGKVFIGSDDKWADFAGDFLGSSRADKEDIAIDWLCESKKKEPSLFERMLRESK